MHLPAPSGFNGTPRLAFGKVRDTKRCKMTNPKKSQLEVLLDEALLDEHDARPNIPSMCLDLGCPNLPLPGDEYCAEHTSEQGIRAGSKLGGGEVGKGEKVGTNPEQPKKLTCPACGNGCVKLFAWGGDGRKVCYSCQQKEIKETEANRRAFKADGEAAMAAERDAKKAEALKQQPGRIELGHWVEILEGLQFMTKVTAINAASVKPKAQRWLWHNRVPAGAITWGVGKPGNAKSLWATDLAARVSSGADFPDGAKNLNGPKKVLMYAGEDDLERTVVPRLIAAGANLNNITLLDNSSFEVYDKEWNRVDKRSIDLSQDCKVISQLMKEYPEIALLILDPTTGVYGNRNTNHDKDMRPIMNDLRDMCEKRGLTIVGITHTNKRGEAAAIDQIQGASSIAGAARAAWLFTRDSESDDEHAHVMTCIKSNLSDNHDGLKLLTKAVEVSPEVGAHPMILWGESTKMQADDANQALKLKREEKNDKRQVAKNMILSLLAEAPVRSPDVYAALKATGISDTTAERAADDLTREFAILRRQKPGQKGWWMTLPQHAGEFESKDVPEVSITLAAGEAL